MDGSATDDDIGRAWGLRTVISGLTLGFSSPVTTIPFCGEV